MGWHEVVAAARASENAEIAALVLSDKPLQRLLAAWPMARIVLSDEADRAGDIDAVLACMRVDERNLATLTGLQMAGVMKALDRAVALRLVYPDNTIHGMGLMVIRKLIQDALAG